MTDTASQRAMAVWRGVAGIVCWEAGHLGASKRTHRGATGRTPRPSAGGRLRRRGLGPAPRRTSWATFRRPPRWRLVPARCSCTADGMPEGWPVWGADESGPVADLRVPARSWRGAGRAFCGLPWRRSAALRLPGRQAPRRPESRWSSSTGPDMAMRGFAHTATAACRRCGICAAPICSRSSEPSTPESKPSSSLTSGSAG